MTPKQIELARHALGLDGRRTHSYRNCFVVGAGAPDYEEWKQMVAAGDAERRDGAKLPYGGDDLFHMTLTGARKAMLAGETLDRENFPKSVTS